MTVIRREDYPDTPWGERTFLIADRDEWCCKAVERASELELVRQQLRGAVARIAELEAELEPYRKAAARERSADRQSDAY